MQSFNLTSIFLLSMVLLTNLVQADEAIHIGSATSVMNDVFSTSNAGETRIKLNDALFFKQQVITKENSNLTVTFRDSSTFAVAPQSSVTLDEFVFNPSENVLEKTISVIKGSFRYISGFPIKGSSAKIITPFGTAGIRGSAVQGTVSSKTGLTMNVGSGSVEFKTKDGKTSIINEGESLTISPECNTLPNVPMATIAGNMEYIENNFSKTPSAPLNAQQQLANAIINNLPVVEQKRAYATALSSSVKPPVSDNAKATDAIASNKTQGDPQETIDRLLKELQHKNKQQVEYAVHDIIAATVASGLNNDQVTQIAINALSAAKPDRQIHIAATILNTLQKLNPTLAATIAPKVQQALPSDKQYELPSLVPDVVFPLSAPSGKTKFLIH